jgi:hypothetical protein
MSIFWPFSCIAALQVQGAVLTVWLFFTHFIIVTLHQSSTCSYDCTGGSSLWKLQKCTSKVGLHVCASHHGYTQCGCRFWGFMSAWAPPTKWAFLCRSPHKGIILLWIAWIRIVSHAEEIAFNDPPGGDTEQMILNNYLNRYICHSRLSAFQKFVQQVSCCMYLVLQLLHLSVLFPEFGSVLEGWQIRWQGEPGLWNIHEIQNMRIGH